MSNLPFSRRLIAVLAVVLSASAGAPVAAKTLTGAYLAATHAAQRQDVTAAAKYYNSALSLAPHDNLLRAQTVNYSVMAGEMDRAVTIARALYGDDPDNQMAVIVLTVDDISAGRFESAASRLEERPKAFTPLLAKLLSGWIAFGLGDVEGAEAAFSDLDGNTLFSMLGRYHLGLALAASGDHAGAESRFAEAAELAGGQTARLLRAQAAALTALGRPEEARALFEQALAENRGDPVVSSALRALEAGATPLVARTAQDGAAEVMLDLADGLAQGQNTPLALVYARFSAFLRPDLDEAQLLIAEILEAQEQHELALDAYAAVAADSPYHVAAQIGRSDALRGLGRIEEALDVLRTLSGRNPEALQAHVALGDLLRSEERFAEAAEAYGAAVDLVDDPASRHWPLYYQRGVALERSGSWDRAEVDFRKALELSPDEPLVLNYLGYSLVEQRRNLEEALEMIERAVEQRPNDGYITDSLGWVLYRLGRYDEAVPHMERAVELTPVDPIINDHLGDVLWKVGRKLEAEFQWRRALSFEPEDEEAARIREKLSRGLDAVLADEAAKAASHAARETNGG